MVSQNTVTPKPETLTSILSLFEKGEADYLH